VYAIDPKAKLTIITLDGEKFSIEAQFNPKEVSHDNQASWKFSTESKGRRRRRSDYGFGPISR
jgi:hypothetical protein